MVEPATIVKGGVAVVKMAKIVRDGLRSLDKTERLKEAMEVDHRSWRAGRDALIDRNFGILAETVENVDVLAEKVAELVNDRQFLKVQANLEYEALREATDERREMLAHAAAGLATPRFTINEKARIERAIRQLDTEDILFLDDLHRFEDPAFTPDPNSEKTSEQQRAIYNDQNRAGFAETLPTSRSALLAVGCISESAGRYGGSTLSVLPVGRMMLDVLALFIMEKRRA